METHFLDQLESPLYTESKDLTTTPRCCLTVRARISYCNDITEQHLKVSSISQSLCYKIAQYLKGI